MVHSFAGLIYFLIMFGWYFGRKIKNRYITFANLNKYIDLFKDLSKDESVPKFATNLVYIIRANRKDQVESKVIYSIFQKQPKRADTYWLLHVDRVTDPNQFDYLCYSNHSRHSYKGRFSYRFQGRAKDQPLFQGGNGGSYGERGDQPRKRV